MKAFAQRLFKRIKHLRFLLAINWPYGYLCRLDSGGKETITLNKQMWVIVSDGQSSDALPISFVSPQLVERLGAELAKKWYWPAAEAAKPEKV